MTNCLANGCPDSPLWQGLCAIHHRMLEPCLVPLWRLGVAQEEILNWLNAVNRRDWSRRPDKALYWMKRYHHRANKIAQAHTSMVECGNAPSGATKG